MAEKIIFEKSQISLDVIDGETEEKISFYEAEEKDADYIHYCNHSPEGNNKPCRREKIIK
jgi:hypothetical protein